jgi:hypothetical protein
MISAVASAASYNVSLPALTRVGETELKPGQYKVSVEGEKATFSSGKKVVAEVPVTVENATKKYANTEVSSSNSSLQTISVGGTTMKIVLKGK